MLAPKFRTNRSADKARTFAEGFGQTQLDNLATGSMPQFPPQVVEFQNSNAAAQSALWRDENGADHTTIVPGGQTRATRIPVFRLNAGSGANISAIAYWWDVPQLDEPQYKFNRGPA